MYSISADTRILRLLSIDESSTRGMTYHTSKWVDKCHREYFFSNKMLSYY